MYEQEELEACQFEEDQQEAQLEDEQECRQEEEEQELEDSVEEQNDLEDQSLDFDLDEVAPQLEVDELIAECEISDQELADYLPDDVYAPEEKEIEAEVTDEGIDDNLIEIDVNQNALVLELDTEEVVEELETYEIVEIEQDVQEDELEDQQEVNIQIEEEIWEEDVEGVQILEEDLEVETDLSSIDLEIEEVIAENELTDLELIQLEREFETIFEEELIEQNVEESEDEEFKEIEETEQQEEHQIEENDDIEITDWTYEAEAELEDEDALCNISESTTTQTEEYEDTTLDQESEEIPPIELESQVEEEGIEELVETDEIDEIPEIIEIKNDHTSINFEDEMQSELSLVPSEIFRIHSSSEIIDVENNFLHIAPISPAIKITPSDQVHQEQSFGLSFDESILPNFSINLLETETRALEEILEEAESPRLLEKFHTRVEEDIQQTLDVETHQIDPDLSNSFELVSQGPTLPEAPPYDFLAELDEWEEEAKEQVISSHRQLIRSLDKAQRAQIAAIHKFNISRNTTGSHLSQLKQNNESVKTPKTIDFKNKRSPHITLKTCEKKIIKLGETITLNSSLKDINEYVDLWNEYVKSGGKLTQQLQNNFDKIAIRTNQEKLARVKILGHSEWTLRSQKGVDSARKYINKWIPNAFLQEGVENKISKIRTGTIIEWLKCRDRITINQKSIGEGAHKIYQKKSFYEIEIQNNVGHSKTLFIPNKKTNWNPDGFQSNNYSPSRKRKSQGAIANILLEPILYHSLVTNEKRQIFLAMQNIFPQLKKSTQIQSRYTIYKPQRDLELDIFDDLLVTEFYKVYTSRGSILFQRASDYLQEIIQKQLRPVVTFITTQTFAGAKGDYFKKTVINKTTIPPTTTKMKSRQRNNRTIYSSRRLKEKKSSVEWVKEKNKVSPRGKINQINTSLKNQEHEIIILGELLSSNFNPLVNDSYIKEWNKYTENSGNISKELKKNFDMILKKIGKDKLVRVKFQNNNGWFLENYPDVKSAQKKVNKWIPNAFPKEETINDCSRARITVVLEWLKCRDKIKILDEYVGKGPYKINQKKSFYEIKVQNDEEQIKTFFIPNKSTNWNPDGLKSHYYSPSSYGRSQSTIAHDLLDSIFYHSLSTDEKRQIFLAMKEIFPQLKESTQIGGAYTIYKPQRNLHLNIFDNLLATKFYNLYASRNLSEFENTSDYIKELMLNQPKPLVNFITNQSFSEAEGNFFNVAIVDREKAFNLFKEKLKRKFRINNFSKQNQEFQKKVREFGLRRISMLYEKARLEVAENVPSFHFTIENALEKGFEITDDYTDFWNEDYVDSFTGVAAGMMQHKDFRLKVLSKFKHLIISKSNTIINSEITGKDIVPGGSISPDITVRKDGEIVEEVEVKQLRPIGRSLKDKTNPTMYWFDFFKTLETEGDPINHISLHFVSKQDDVESMGWDCAKNGIGGVIVEAGEIKGLPKRLNEIITAFSYERWPSAHRIDIIPKTENRDLVMGIMERLETSAERKNQLREVITETEVEEFVRGVHIFPKAFKQHRGYVEILIYVLKKYFN